MPEIFTWQLLRSFIAGGSEAVQLELMFASAASSALQQNCFGTEAELNLVFRSGSVH